MSTLAIILLWIIIIAAGTVGIIFVIRTKKNIFSYDDGLGLLFLIVWTISGIQDCPKKD